MTSKISLTLILAILSFSTIIPALAYAQPIGNTAAEWQYPNGNSWAQTYSPQTDINRDNIDDLEVKWIFPLNEKNVPEALRSTLTGAGSATPPIVADGKVFVTTQYLRTYGIDADDGSFIWSHDYTLNVDEIEERLPVLLPPNSGFLGLLNQHLHGIKYWEAGNSIILNGMACDFYGVDIDDGTESFHIEDLCLDIPGNLYKYRQGTANTDGVGTYDEGNLFIFVLPGLMHSWAWEGDARHVTLGVDMDSGQIQWRLFSYPPQTVPTQDWALQECDVGFFQEIPCSEVAASNPENLEWDWALPGETPNIFGGVTANWGSTPVVDEDTGIMYTQTGNQGPYTYIGTTPGPRLYGSTIMAVDLETGNRIWWLQPMPRDPYDYDCNWDGILAEIPGLGKVYMKACKEGRLYVMDAATGEPHYVVDVIDEQIEWGQITSAAAKEPFEGGVKYHLMDPFSYYDMREMVSPDNSIYCGRPCEIYPYFGNGLMGTDMSFDPETGTLFHYAIGLQVSLIESLDPNTVGNYGSVSITQVRPVFNTTIVARDVATGEVKWTYFWDVAQQRAHLVVTPTLVFSAFGDGFMRFFDKDTGILLREISLGAGLRIGPTTGQDSEGNQKIFALVTPGQNPGYVMALGLKPGATTTTTVISTTTQSTTITSTSTSTTTATSTTTSATTTTVTSTSTSSTTSTVTSTTTSATTSTVTTTGMASTTTVTSEVTEETGLPAEVTYAAIAVAVIAIIAAAVLTMRKK
jgi:outer membrane protein assembly factor BamB